MSVISVNLNAYKILEEVCRKPELYRVIVEESETGAKVIDAGIRAKGGLSIGKVITEVCLGGLGRAEINHAQYGDLTLPAITVYTDRPAISTLGSQLAGWHIKVGEYSAIGSGPARALALKPKSIYKEISYKDYADVAVIVLEASQEPPDEVISYISERCGIKPERLMVVVFSTSSIAGLVQVSGRIVEVGIHRLFRLGVEPRLFMEAYGSAPIMPVHPDPAEAMGRANDAILYGGVTYYNIAHDDDGSLESIVKRAVSSASRQYGRPFIEIFRDANFDFYKVDPNLFAPASMVVSNSKTGKVFSAGAVDPDMIKRSIGL